MTRVLTFDNKKCISNWIGGKNKEFTLLYSAFENGCDPATFHARCDNKGSTLTVVFNTNGNIYGGYARTSWMPGDIASVYDADAFLFALEGKNEQKATKYVVKTPEHALTKASDCGPTFGKGPDLQVFKGTITKDTDIFPLNSIMVPGSYLWSQETVTSLTGGKYEANDVHVYAVKDATNESTLERPFQDIDSQVWNAELLRKLKGEVENYWPLRDMGVSENKIPYINILLLGPVGAGKSSFFNTLNSIFRGRLSIVARTGSCDSSLTKTFNIYSIVGNGKKLKFRICDCRGLEDAQGVEINDIESVLDGHVKNKYPFNDKSTISKDSPFYRRNPEMHDRIHCVAFVVDANNDPDYPMTERVHEQIKKLQDLMNNAGIPQLVLMNKIDGILDETGRELSSVFYSPEVKKRVDKLAKALRLPPNTVLPMKNIDSEQKPTTNIAILALYNLRQMLHAADDFLLNYLDDFLVLTEHVPPENSERNAEMVHERNAEKTEMLHERKTEILSEETEIMTDPVTNKNSLLDGESNTDKESDID